jgi:hypothetical protein
MGEQSNTNTKPGGSGHSHSAVAPKSGGSGHSHCNLCPQSAVEGGRGAGGGGHLRPRREQKHNCSTKPQLLKWENTTSAPIATKFAGNPNGRLGDFKRDRAFRQHGAIASSSQFPQNIYIYITLYIGKVMLCICSFSRMGTTTNIASHTNVSMRI